MNIRSIVKTKNGAAMEWAIIFGLIISVLIILAATAITGFAVRVRASSVKDLRQSELNQVGEYFIDSVKSEKAFTSDGILDGTLKDKIVAKYEIVDNQDGTKRKLVIKAKDNDGVAFCVVTDTAANVNDPQILWWGNRDYPGGGTWSAFREKPKEYIQYDITFNLDGGKYDGKTAYTTKSSKETGKYTIDLDRSKLTKTKSSTYYLVLDWTDSNGNKYNFGDSFDVTENVTLKANWAKRVKVTFKANTNGSVSTSSVYVPSGQKIYIDKNLNTINCYGTNVVASSTKTGYEFSQWDKSTGEITVSSATTITASFAKASYKITYDYNGGTGSPESQSVDSGASITLPTPVRSGYTFLGWGDEKLKGSYKPTSNVVLIAQWEKQLVITYNYNGGTGSPASQSVDKGSSVTLPTPERSGYKFLGWGDGKLKGSYTPTSDVTLTAQWEKQNLITYNYNGGTGSPASQYVNKGSSVTLPTPERSGYKFLGWGDGKLKGSYTPTSDVTLVAQWEKRLVITYNYNGGTGSPDSQTVDKGSSVTLPTPERTGHTFLGWGDGKLKGSYTPTSDVTLVAQWEANKHKVTLSLSEAAGSISYNGNTVSTSGGSLNNVPYGAKVSVTCSSFSQSSSKTVKWTDGNLGTSTGSYSFTMPDKDVTVTMSSEASCIASGTLVTLADGTKKKVEDITLGDKVLAFDHETGTVVPADINFIEADGYDFYKVVVLEWSDGTVSRIIDEHGFFDLDLMKYVYIHEDDFDQYIGDRFYTGIYENGEYKAGEVTLANAYVTEEYTGCYSFPSVYHLNYYIEDKLSMPGGIAGMFNIFDYDGDLKYNESKMNADIEFYGLFDYANVSEFISYDTFCTYPAQYLYVSVGKGLLTEADLQYLIERYAVKYDVIGQ